jgi:NTE family protein
LVYGKVAYIAGIVKLNLTMSQEKKHKFGIALSGGGARGIAHLGVLEMLEEKKISPSIICGTSVGAIFGALYSAGISFDEIKKMISSESHTLKLIFGGMPSFSGLLSLSYLESFLKKAIPHDSFEGLQKELIVCVTNINSGKAEYVTSGSLSKAICASCSVPGIFQPTMIDGKCYVDGGISNNLPARILREKAATLFGVSVIHLDNPDNQENTKETEKIEEKVNTKQMSLPSLIKKVIEIGIHANTKYDESLVDILIEPKGISHFSYYDFSKSEELVSLGKSETEKALQSRQKLFLE